MSWLDLGEREEKRKEPVAAPDRRKEKGRPPVFRFPQAGLSPHRRRGEKKNRGKISSTKKKKERREKGISLELHRKKEGKNTINATKKKNARR